MINLPIGITTYFIIIILFIFIKSWKYFVINFIIFFFIFYFASFFINPPSDHNAYMYYLKNYTNIYEALRDNRETFTPASSFPFLFYKLTNSYSLIIYISNAIVFSALLNMFNALFKNETRLNNNKFINYFFPIVLISLSPILIQTGVSLNKDFYAAFFICFITLLNIKIYYLLKNIYALKLLDIALITFYFILTLISLSYLQKIRWASYNILLCSILIFYASKIIYFISNFKINEYLSTIFSTFFLIIYALTQKWDNLTIAYYENLSNSMITEIHNSIKPDLLNSLYYLFKGYFLSIFGIYTSQFTWSNISILTSFIAFFDNLLFIFFMIIFYLNRNKKLFLFIFPFILLHIGIQIWGTPNYGNLFRQRIIDIFLILILIISPNSQKEMNHGKE
ncbi:hypothetical protein [Silvanigrella sp.]|jgi:hypothetical protein|uniref:hypothetical protein n=1 Tax=Silvanigrella sp. TaxID=2024976 RepID=UPI0037CB01B2